MFWSESACPQTERLVDIQSGESFVKVKPDHIGDLVFFDTTKPSAKPLDEAVYKRRKRISLIATAGVLILIWLLLYREWEVALFLSLVAVVAGYVFWAIQTFKGVDYFVGTQGFAIFDFSRSRENVTRKQAYPFEDGFVLLHQEIHDDRSHEAGGYRYVLLRKPDGAGVAEVAYQFKGVNRDPMRDFEWKMEEQASSLALESAENLIASGEAAPFFVMRKENGKEAYKIVNTILLSEDSIQIGNQFFPQETWKKIRIEDEKLMFPGEGSLMKRLVPKEIPLNDIGNLATLLMLLSNMYSIDSGWHPFGGGASYGTVTGGTWTGASSLAAWTCGVETAFVFGCA